MSNKSYGRRAILGGGLMAAGIAGIAAPEAVLARAAAPAAPAWRPQSEPQDAWLDRPATRHRLVVDTSSAASAGMGLLYADTFYASNLSGYGLRPETLAVVLVLRHLSTPFGYDDAVWSKYGAAFAEKLELKGEQAARAPHGNPLLAGAAEADPTLGSLFEKGARFAVCGVATHFMAMMLAKKTGGSAPAVEAELKAHLVPGAVLMASGVVAVNRAQEHGYTFVSGAS